MFLTKKFSFDAAHKLPGYKGKCKNLHGHTYYLKVTVEGKVNPQTGMIIDFFDLEKIVEDKILNYLDHSFLNDKIKMPTTENVALWIWDKLNDNFLKNNCKLYEIKLFENSESSVTIRR
jgi:6-pyruvoyltetrahydropterin/6-carboxytetrahydropterin synthase